MHSISIFLKDLQNPNTLTLASYPVQSIYCAVEINLDTTTTIAVQPFMRDERRDDWFQGELTKVLRLKTGIQTAWMFTLRLR